MTSGVRLRPTDAALLHLEAADTPLHTGSVAILDGAGLRCADGRLRFRDLRDHIERRLHLDPRLRQRMATVPLAQGRPVWVDDPDFDIAYHVRHTALPAPGRPEQLCLLVSRLMAQLLDRSRPLWEVWIVEGLAGGRIAVVDKTHPAMVDGVESVHRWSVLFDDRPDAPEELAPPWVPYPLPTPVELLGRAWWDRTVDPREGVRVLGAAVRGARRRVGGLVDATRDLSAAVTRSDHEPRQVLQRRGGRQRRIALVELPLAPVQRAHRTHGASVHEVVLAAVLAGVDRVLTGRGEPTTNRVLRALVPITVVPPGDDPARADALHAEVRATVADLPLDVTDPLERLRAVQAATGVVRAGTAASGAPAVGARELMATSAWAAPTFFDLATRAVQRMGERETAAPLLVVDVPGPQHPVWCLGARLLEWYPIVPLARHTALAIGVFSYDGRLLVGLNADAATLPDLAPLAAGLRDAVVVGPEPGGGRRRDPAR